MLILTIAEDFNKLFENSRLTAIAALSELGRVMVMTIYVSLVFVVAVLSTKDGRAYRASKMFDMIFSVERGDVRPTQGASTCMTEQVQPAEVIRFAKRVLIRRLFGDGEELGCDNFAAVLNKVSNCKEICELDVRTWQVKHSRW